MFGVKLEESVEQPPTSSRRAAPAAAGAGPKKMFFGVEVADENPGPALSLSEGDEVTNPSISTFSTRAPSKLTVGLLCVLLGALSLAAWQMGQLRSVRRTSASLSEQLGTETAKADALAAQNKKLTSRVSALEDDKTKLTEQLAVKSQSLDEALAKASKSKGSHGKSKAKRHGRKPVG